MFHLDRRCFEPGIAFTRAQIAGFFGLESLEAVVAESRGKLVGFAIGYLRRPTVAGILTLDVDADSRRHGVGRALFTELLTRLERAARRPCASRWTSATRRRKAFYRSFGFRKIGRIPDYYGEGKDAFEMERSELPKAGSRGLAS